MKKKLLVILITIISLGISSCAMQQYTCPGIYQEPTSIKSIPSRYERLDVSKKFEATKKLQQKTSKKSFARGNGRYSYRKK